MRNSVASFLNFDLVLHKRRSIVCGSESGGEIPMEVAVWRENYDALMMK